MRIQRRRFKWILALSAEIDDYATLKQSQLLKKVQGQVLLIF